MFGEQLGLEHLLQWPDSAGTSNNLLCDITWYVKISYCCKYPTTGQTPCRCNILLRLLVLMLHQQVEWDVSVGLT